MKVLRRHNGIEYQIREDGVNLIFTVEVLSPPEKLSERKELNKFLADVAKEIKEHRKKYACWKYRIEVKDKTSEELIKSGINDLLFSYSPLFDYLLPLSLGTGALGGIAYYLSSIPTYKSALEGLLCGTVIAEVSVIFSLILDLYSSKKNQKRHNLLNRIEVYTKEQ